MRLSARGRYAVSAMVALARGDGKSKSPSRRLSREGGVPAAYLDRLLADLSRGGLVRGKRGPGGGYVLGRRAEEISVAEVLSAVGEEVRATRCRGKQDVLGCMGKGERCATHNLWAALGEGAMAYLGGVSVATAAGGGPDAEEVRAAFSRLWSEGEKDGEAER